jgi:hypothetical protein
LRFKHGLEKTLQTISSRKVDWYVYLFRVNQAQDKWPKTERAVRHLLMAKTQYRSSRA